MAKSRAKAKVARTRERNADGTFVPAPKKYAMPMAGDNSIGNDHVEGHPFIASPHDTLAKVAPPGMTPVAPNVWHANIFRMISGVPNQVYRNLDEALRSNRISAKAMMADVAITGPVWQRILHLVSCNDGLVPEDENDEEQIEACDHLWNIVQETKDWAEFKRTLAEALWYGKVVNKVDYRWEYWNGKRTMLCRDFTNIIGDKLVFRTNGEMGYIVHQPTGLRDCVVTDIGRAELFNDDDYEALVHHRYFMVDVPYDEGMLSIGREGFGYRNYLYYVWWLKQQVLEWAMLGLQIYGNGGLRIAYFEEGNLDSQKAVAQAMAEANGTNILLFPRPIGVEKQGAGVEIIAPQGMGLDWFREFLSSYFGKQINIMLLGQDYDGERRDFFAYLKYDAQKLSQTITEQFVRVLQKYNMPEYKHRISYKIAVPHYAPEMVLTAAQRLYEMSADVGAREVAELVGLTVPGKGRKILHKEPGEDQTMKKPIVGGDPLEHQLSGGTGEKERLAANANRENAPEPVEAAA